MFAGGYIGRILHYLGEDTVFIENWVVRRCNPDLASILTDALEFSGLELAGSQVIPELLVACASLILFGDENTVRFPYQVSMGVTEGTKIIVIRLDDRFIQIELNHHLRPVDCFNLATVVRHRVFFFLPDYCERQCISGPFCIP